MKRIHQTILTLTSLVSIQLLAQKSFATSHYTTSLFEVQVPASKKFSRTMSLETVSLFDKFVQQGVPSENLEKAFTFFDQNKQRIKNTKYITMIDFSLPSIEKRLFLLNLETGSVRKFWVAHGRASGGLFARSFSNVDNSKKSSLGMYITGGTYVGKHGRSMYLYGLDRTNSNAYSRDIVVHGAPYVSAAFIRQSGYLGRSWGCPAVSNSVIQPLMKLTQKGSLMYIFKNEEEGILSTVKHAKLSEEVFVADVNENLKSAPAPLNHSQSIAEE
jgi:hypothetical protein